MASHTVVFHPIIAAIKKSEDMLGKDRDWCTVNEHQRRFKKDWLDSSAEDLSKFTLDELRSWASRMASELNTIASSENFDIVFEEFEDNEFGVLSILNVLVEWLIEGQITNIRKNNKIYPAVGFSIVNPMANEPKDWMLFSVGTSQAQEHHIVQMKTKTGDKVFMTIADRELSGFELLDRINHIRAGYEEVNYAEHRYESLRFPMILLDQFVDISWLVGLNTLDSLGEPCVISKAMQQTKFRMNTVGARVKSAVALVFERSVSMEVPKEFVVDEPFFLWIERPDLENPIMYAYLDTDDWKDPGTLDM